MSRRHPGPVAQEVAPKGCPRAGDRWRTPLLPKLTSPELRAARGAGGGGSWWQDRDPDPRVGFRSPAQRLPALHTVTPPVARKCKGLRSLLLPPLLVAGAPRGSPSRCRPPAEVRAPRRGAAGEVPDSLGALLGELLPSRFREFLLQLRAKCAELPEPQKPQSDYRRRVSEHCRGSPQCPNCPFLPDLWDQSPHLEDSLKSFLYQKPTLRGDRSQFTTVKKTNQLYNTQPPKIKAVLIHSSGEGSGTRRRSYPFRVRFADETLRDTALRYWERNCAIQQNIFKNKPTILPDVPVTERVFRNVGKWLESLPKALYPRLEEAVANSSCWDYPDLSTQEPEGHFSEDASMSRSLPFIPRPATPRPPGNLKTFLDTKDDLEQVGTSPCFWGHNLSVADKGLGSGTGFLLWRTELLTESAPSGCHQRLLQPSGSSFSL